MGQAAPTWVFDVDGCLIDSLSGDSLRPGASELLTGLKAGGVRLLLWSAGGEEYAERRAAAHGIDAFFSGFYSKGSRDTDGHYRIDHLPLGDGVATFVDDQPADLGATWPVIGVRPYLAANRHDTGLAVVTALLSNSDRHD